MREAAITSWTEQILRQGQRLSEDQLPRAAGMLGAYLLAFLVLPAGVTLTIGLLQLGTEFWQARAYARFAKRPGSRAYYETLLSSTTGFLVFCTLPVLMLQHEEPAVRLVSTAYIIGALLQVVTVRSAHLSTCLLNFVPPGAALVHIGLLGLFGPAPVTTKLFLGGVTLLLIAYFVGMLLLNHAAQKSLLQAHARAQSASAAKTRFLAAMSHEMLTPLNAILGLASLLRADLADPVQEAKARRVQEAGKSLLRMVEDVLDVAEDDPGRHASRPVTANLRREVEEAIAGFTRRNDLPEDSVALDLDPDLPKLGRIDARHMRRALAQLMAQAQAGGAARIRVGAARREGRLLLTVAPETAPGDPAPQTLHAADQTSLGADDQPFAVQLAARLAETMGGSLSLAPDATGRPQAVLSLPVADLPPLPVVDETAPPGPLRALVVDDIGTNRLIVAALLRRLGIGSAEAASGPEALALLAADRFDIVLLDMNMDGMDGAATFAAIRASGEPWARIPVVAVTANTLREQRDSYLELGLSGYVPKPVDRAHLWAEISAALHKPHPAET